MAIASGVLQHLVDVTDCKTLFITHYPSIAKELEHKYPSKLQNLHMGYHLQDRVDGIKDVTFCYKLTRGLSQRMPSFQPALGKADVEPCRFLRSGVRAVSWIARIYLTDGCRKSIVLANRC